MQLHPVHFGHKEGEGGYDVKPEFFDCSNDYKDTSWVLPEKYSELPAGIIANIEILKERDWGHLITPRLSNTPLKSHQESSQALIKDVN